MRFLIVCCVACPILWAAQETEYKLPNGQGKALVEKICAKCHDLEGIVRARNTREGWEMVVDEMIARGAEGTDQEIDQVIDYLATHFAKVNVNKATAGELIEALSVSKETASAIVAYREKNGPFKEWNDLQKVPGLDVKKIEDKKGRIVFK